MRAPRRARPTRSSSARSTSCAPELRARVAALAARGTASQLYGESAAARPGTGGLHAFFLITDKPEIYNLPPAPAVPTTGVGRSWLAAAAGALGPAYFYVSGLAGAAASLAAAIELAGERRPLARKLHWLATSGEVAGAALLIADLGRPSRFHHMLRVVRPTSPMNVGTWILSSAGATGALGLLCTLRDRRAPALVSVAGLASGAALTTYTGVLIGNTSVPLWSATRRRLPLWFAASSAASLAAALELLAPDHRLVRIYGTIAKAAYLVTAHAVARAARAHSVDAPLRRGPSGTLWRCTTWLGVASLATTLWPGRRPWLAGALGTAAALLGRLAITSAGRASAADPRATFAPQRRAL